MKHWCLNFISVCAVLLLFASMGSCRKDFEYADSTGNLTFSKDTVFLDTIFSNIGSATYSLKVYNKGISDINIPFIGMETGESSNYRLNVDGSAGKEFSDIPLLAKDSLFIFIETTFDVSQTNANEFLLTEGLLFGVGEETQRVELVTLVKDAVFLYPQTQADGSKETVLIDADTEGNPVYVEGFYLDDGHLQFTNEKPYVIYGYAVVTNGNTLQMAAGTRVHFHNNSGLIVESGASLLVNGALSEDQELLENEVIFEGDRLEPGYADEPGQWGTLWIKEGSTNNQLEHLTIKNATVGLRVDGSFPLNSPTLTLKNAQIFNSLNQNLWASTAAITATNTILGGAGGNSFLIDLGGSYQFVHCTIANYWNNGFRSGVALAINNFKENQSTNLEQADFINTIVAGSSAVEYVLQVDEEADFNFRFQNCLVQFNDTNNAFTTNPLYNFADPNRYFEVIFDKEPDFFLPFSNQFNIGPDSFAIDAADPDFSPPISTDIIGIDRSPFPDIGAYEFHSQN